MKYIDGDGLLYLIQRIKEWLGSKANTSDLASVALSGSYNDLKNKPTIPSAVTVDTALSSTSTNPVENKAVHEALGNKVDKVSGKGLSTNDFTTTLKNKLDGIAAGANKYEHPAHTAASEGLYKVTVDSLGHVTGTTAVAKSDITALGIPSTNTTYTFNTTYNASTNKAATMKDIESAIAGVTQFDYQSVTTLPTTGTKGVIYLVPNSETGDSQHDEYIWVGSRYEKIGPKIDLSGYVTSGALSTALNDKVDKVSGKGLSTNDFTTTLKNKLDNIAAGAEVNVQADWNQTDTTKDDYIKNKPTIPNAVTVDTALSSTSTNPVQNKAVHSALAGKVPTTRKINDKALSADITLSASDVSAVAKSGDTMSGNLSIEKAEGTPAVSVKRTDGNREIRFEIASNGTSAGIYDGVNAKWLLRSDGGADLRLPVWASTGDTNTPIYINADGKAAPISIAALTNAEIKTICDTAMSAT